MNPKLNYSLDDLRCAASTVPLRRRTLLAGAVMAPLLAACAAPVRPGAAQPEHADTQAAWRRLESASGGRLGVAIFGADGSGASYRAGERFPACSTFKVLAAAGVLQQSAQDGALLQRRVAVRREELVNYSPITQKHAGSTMTFAELCAAALQHSDNTAGNLLLRQLGGPAGLTRYARSLGDDTFRLDRWETELNTAIPGDPRDTCTPTDMAQSAHRLLVGNALPPEQRAQLVRWMLANTTGDTRIRAGVPPEWRVADKTGSGDYGATNDLAVLWPPAGQPLALAVYFTQPRQDAKAKSEVIAEATRIAVKGLAG